MDGIYKVTDFESQIDRVVAHGYDRGPDIGYMKLDQHYRPKLGMFTVITGIPGHGKTEFLDQVIIKLAEKHGWKFALYSPENFPLFQHFIKLAEKIEGQNFKGFDKAALRTSKKWVGEHFTWIYPSDKEPVTLEIVLEKVRYLVESEGINGFVLDPWGEIEHNRGNMSETDYTSQSLSKIRRFSREYEVHTWVVAHPTKLQKDKNTGNYPVPTPYDISGSASWRNKLDFCITVHRPDIHKNELQVHILKVKFKQMGKIGQVDFNYDYETGRITEK